MFNDRYGLTDAVLSSRKRQTRRIAYDFRQHANNKVGKCILLDNNNLTYKDGEVQVLDELPKPQYQVSEVVAIAQAYNDFYNDECDPRIFPDGAGWNNKMFVRADLMPHHIRITNVRVERLQDISDEDCIKEGIEWDHKAQRFYVRYDSKTHSRMWFAETPRETYAVLIDCISGKGTWDSNPYVFVYDFELVK